MKMSDWLVQLREEMLEETHKVAGRRTNGHIAYDPIYPWDFVSDLNKVLPWTEVHWDLTGQQFEQR
jgi:hypothetical protein